MVLPIQKNDLSARTLKSLGSFKPGEPSADDHHPRMLRGTITLCHSSLLSRLNVSAVHSVPDYRLSDWIAEIARSSE